MEKLGRLVIDLESIINGSNADIILEDGDSLHIPKMQQNISVIGEVFVPRTHLFTQGLNLNDYISLSGGVGPYADADNIYLIRVDGSMVSPTQLSSSRFFRGSSSKELQPGDSIVVPLEVKPFSGIRATNEITQIIYQMALAAAAVNSF
jgi:protein involved in polysaccharide export with SLBB domain